MSLDINEGCTQQLGKLLGLHLLGGLACGTAGRCIGRQSSIVINILTATLSYATVSTRYELNGTIVVADCLTTTVVTANNSSDDIRSFRYTVSIAIVNFADALINPSNDMSRLMAVRSDDSA